MKTYTIPARISGTGSIHSIASEFYDREIKFRKDCEYAVVLASYYGDTYKTFKSEKACARYARKMKDYSYQIIDAEGNRYNAYGDELYLDNLY
jgi:hypothetical protein